MAEICSAYPASGALYFWSDKLATKHHRIASWITAWVNGIGQVAGTAGAAYSMALFLGAYISFKTGWSPTLHETFAMFLGRISFPLYLVHVMPLMGLRYILMAWKPGWPYDALGLLLYVLFVVGAASLLHVWIERPFQRWSHALLGRRPRTLQPEAHSTGAA